jgi:hypothetical protein
MQGRPPRQKYAEKRGASEARWKKGRKIIRKFVFLGNINIAAFVGFPDEQPISRTTLICSFPGLFASDSPRGSGGRLVDEQQD